MAMSPFPSFHDLVHQAIQYKIILRVMEAHALPQVTFFSNDHGNNGYSSNGSGGGCSNRGSGNSSGANFGGGRGFSSWGNSNRGGGNSGGDGGHSSGGGGPGVAGLMFPSVKSIG